MRNKIYIVEDEIIVANDIREILMNHGFQVTGIATHYETARKQIPELSPDLVLCDINLNGKMSGIALITELRKLSTFRTIFITAYSDDETIRESNKVNASNYLTKPFNEKQLVTSVRLALMTAETDTEDRQMPSRRELTIIGLLARGHNSEEIAALLFISKNTVDTHRRHMLRKFSVKSTSELVALALGSKWI